MSVDTFLDRVKHEHEKSMKKTEVNQIQGVISILPLTAATSHPTYILTAHKHFNS